LNSGIPTDKKAPYEMVCETGLLRVSAGFCS
jgi:hypothetical protein